VDSTCRFPVPAPPTPRDEAKDPAAASKRRQLLWTRLIVVKSNLLLLTGYELLVLAFSACSLFRNSFSIRSLEDEAETLISLGPWMALG
jgi:hypothetical protein